MHHPSRPTSGPTFWQRRLWAILLLTAVVMLTVGTLAGLAIDGHGDTTGAILLAGSYMLLPGALLATLAGRIWGCRK